MIWRNIFIATVLISQSLAFCARKQTIKTQTTKSAGPSQISSSALLKASAAIGAVVASSGMSFWLGYNYALKNIPLHLENNQQNNGNSTNVVVNITATPPTNISAPPPPPALPPVNTNISGSPLPENEPNPENGSMSSLFDSIRKGTYLKKTVTVDKSSPMLPTKDEKKPINPLFAEASTKKLRPLITTAKNPLPPPQENEAQRISREMQKRRNSTQPQ